MRGVDEDCAREEVSSFMGTNRVDDTEFIKCVRSNQTMNYVSIAQVVLSLILIVLILLQERTSGLSGAFGGGAEGGAYQTRRGFERIIFAATIVIAVAFAVLSLVNLIK